MDDTKMTVKKKNMGTTGKKKPPIPRSKHKRTQMTIQEQWQKKLRKRKRMAEYFYTLKKQKTVQQTRSKIKADKEKGIDVDEMTESRRYEISTSKKFPIYHYLKPKDRALLHKMGDKEGAL